MEEIKYNISSIEHDLSKLDTTYDKTSNLRDIISDKLMGSIKNLVLDPKVDDCDTTMAKMQIVNSAASLLNDIDKQILQRANIKIKLKDIENQDLDRREVTSILKSISLKNIDEYIIPEDNEVHEDIDKVLEASNEVITEGVLKESDTDYEVEDYDGFDL